ncbi:DUF4097 family beta strand repeat-containing protein [Streptomyces lavendulae]|uniref:DUF4097 family beta strand repeat-containing protein n=1 Tax=Streptomyces lavendulae TaxID=1914 RepID=UPI0024A046EC|nr:DUF4097 family beta strand repeat-containing protein [Streptomyces lavendulae]GLX18718.1 hypothetical protein Slala01_23620 [Streptomyces lavendulae subsp. lavendulae]GLX29359.1 hypothetical protein Slala02_51790 [Streptomyces lavendulae subsp. lavendulae]
MQNFATTTAITTVLDIPAGAIRFIATDRADTTVEILPANAGKSRDVKAAEEATVELRDGVLYVNSPQKNEAFGASGSVDVTVQLPAGSSVEAKTASARFTTTGRLGDVSLESAHGTVTLEEAAGARIALAAGDITVGRLTGSADIRSQKGDLTIGEATGGTVTLRTEHGDITVGAARGVSATLDAGTSYGRIDNALQNAGGDDTLTIHATTAYGDITARTV